MINLEDGRNATKFARKVIETSVKNEELKLSNFEEVFNQKLGVFVTIHTYPSYNLRGCIGIPQPIMSLKNAIIEAGKSVIKDPRFPILKENELKIIIIEITVLTKPELIKVNKPIDYVSAIELGRDGLIIEKGLHKGLLLPQVPIEQEWDKEEFLSNACMKAYLTPDSWLDEEIKIYKFKGQIFSEIEPNGEINEKKLDGYNS